jgi:Outer membrane protein beta-barrel domain
MKIRKIQLLSALLAMLAVTAVSAQDGDFGKLYFGVGYSKVRLTMPNSTEARPNMYQITMGMHLHPNLAVEQVLGFNADSVPITRSGVTGFVKMKTSTGIYLKPRVSLLDNKVTVFGRFGYASTAVDYTTFPYVQSLGDKSFGLGVSYKLSDTVYLNVDHMSNFKRNGIEVKGTSVGIGFSF